MEKSYVSAIIEAPVGEVWKCLRNFDAVVEYYDRVESATIADGKSPDTVGCERIAVLQMEAASGNSYWGCRTPTIPPPIPCSRQGWGWRATRRPCGCCRLPTAIILSSNGAARTRSLARIRRQFTISSKKTCTWPVCAACRSCSNTGRSTRLWGAAAIPGRTR